MITPRNGPFGGISKRVQTQMPSNRQSGTAERIRNIFMRSLGLNLSEADLDYERHLDEYAGLDSLAVLEFVGALEREFGIMIEPELLRLEFVRDVEKLSAYVDELVARVADSSNPS